MQPPQSTSDIDSYWEYTDPAASEARFRTALRSAQGDNRLELLTQIARTFSLRGRFNEAHELLSEVEKQLPNAGVRPHIRYCLERGRTFNSSSAKDQARPLFVQAWEQAQAAQLEGLAVDACFWQDKSEPNGRIKCHHLRIKTGQTAEQNITGRSAKMTPPETKKETVCLRAVPFTG